MADTTHIHGRPRAFGPHEIITSGANSEPIAVSAANAAVGAALVRTATGFAFAPSVTTGVPDGIPATSIGTGAVDNTEFAFLDGVTSPIQAQLNAKANNPHTHAAADITSGTLDVARLPTGIPASSIGAGVVDNTEFSFLDGVTSSIQSQLNAKASTTHTHAASDITSGTLSVDRGGTGAATHTAGNILRGNGTSAITSTLAAPSGALVGTTDVQTLTNKTITDTTNTVTASGLRSATTTVSVSAATAPSSGQVLTATSSTTATWQTAATGDVTTSGAQTLSNKSLVDANTFIVDDVDPTKKAQFQIGGVSTGTTRTFSVPDISDTIAVLTAVQTLLNKSFVDASTFIVDDVDPTKKLQFQLNGILTGTTRTLTVPDISDTIAVLTAIQTLTNKSLVDASTFIVDDVDPTKKLQFQVNGISTGTTRTLTVPNASDTLAVLATAQTLTNKTITDTTNNVTANGLRSATTTVAVSSATAPSIGQVLAATSSSAATWQSPTLDFLSDVNTAGVQNGYVLRYDGTSSTWFAQRVNTPTAAVVSGTVFYEENNGGGSTSQTTNTTPTQLAAFNDVVSVPDGTKFTQTGSCSFQATATGTLAISGHFLGGTSGSSTSTMVARKNGSNIAGTTVTFSGTGPTTQDYTFNVSVVNGDTFDIVLTTSTSRTVTMSDGSFLNITFS